MTASLDYILGLYGFTDEQWELAMEGMCPIDHSTMFEGFGCRACEIARHCKQDTSTLKNWAEKVAGL